MCVCVCVCVCLTQQDNIKKNSLEHEQQMENLKKEHTLHLKVHTHTTLGGTYKHFMLKGFCRVWGGVLVISVFVTFLCKL